MNSAKRFRRSLIAIGVLLCVVIAGYLILRAPERERQLYGTWHLYSVSNGTPSYNLVDYRFTPGHRFEARSASYRDGAFRYDPFKQGTDRWIVEPNGELVFVSPQTLGNMFDQLIRRIQRKPTVSREREWGYLVRTSDNEYRLMFAKPTNMHVTGTQGAGYLLRRVDPTSDVAPAPNRAAFDE